MVKGIKGVINDHDALSREGKALSKYIVDLTGEENHATGTINDDIVDVGDRVAYLVYKTAELHADFAKAEEQSRGYLKDIRNSENALNAQRDKRLQLQREIAKLKNQAKQDSHTASKIADLEDDLESQFTKQGSPLANAEAAAANVRREKLHEAYKVHFEALQALGEKLAIVGAYGQELVHGFDRSSSAGRTDYTGAARTAAIRNGVEQDLKNWTAAQARTPRPSLPAGGPHTATASSASSTYAPSFADSHRTELAAIPSEAVAAHASAIDSYYPKDNAQSTTQGRHLSTHSSDSHMAVANAAVGGTSQSFPPPPRHPSQRNSGSAAHSASPLVDNLNNAPVTSIAGALPSAGNVPASATPLRSPPTSAKARDPFADPTVSGVGVGTTTSQSPAHAPVLPASATTSMPTVAETGAPIIGTGGPSSGVLASPGQPKSKEDEARAETQRRFDELRSGASGSGADLERDVSMRGRREGEQLPAYSTSNQQ